MVERRADLEGREKAELVGKGKKKSLPPGVVVAPLLELFPKRLDRHLSCLA